MDPGSAAHRHSASKTRVNALVALRSIRGTHSSSRGARALREPRRITVRGPSSETRRLARARNPYSRWWLWIPNSFGACHRVALCADPLARPAMTNG